MSSNHESSSSGASFSSFLKESRAKLDAASEKGRNYMNKDHGSNGGGGGGHHFSSFTNKITGPSEPAPTIEARPLSALKDPKSFPAPPLHRAAHGDTSRPVAHYPPAATAQPPVAAAGAPAYAYPQPAAYPPPATTAAAYPPPATAAPPAAAYPPGYPQPGYPQPGYPQPAYQQQPPPAAPGPQAYQPAPTGYQPPAPGYQPPAPGYQPPAPGYQPAAPGYQPPAATYPPPPAAAVPVAAPVAVSPPVPAPAPAPTPYQPPPPPGLPGYQSPGGVPATPARAPPQLPTRQNSVAYRPSASSPGPVEPEPKPHVPLPDPSSFPAPPPLYQGPTGAPEPTNSKGRRTSSYTSSKSAQHSSASPTTAAPPPAPLPAASSFPPPPGVQPYQPHLARTVPPPPAPAAAPISRPPSTVVPTPSAASNVSIGYSPSIKKKPPPVPSKLNKKSPPAPPGRNSGAPPAPPSRASTFEESPPPPYTDPRPASPAESENNHFHRTFAARDPGLSQEAQAYQASASNSTTPVGPIAGGTASQIAKQFEKMHILSPQRRPSDHFPASEYPSVHAATAATHHSPSAASIAAHHKKAPPKPPKKHSISHEPLPHEQASTTNVPPPINYSTRPSGDLLTPSTSHSSANSVAAQPPSAALGTNKNDPKGEFDLDLPSLWFTKPARTLTLPASLQGINYTFSLSSSSGSSRKLILALRIAETLAIVKFKLEWKVEDPLGTVVVERKDVPPPEPMAQAQLSQAHDAFGEGVARYAESVIGTQVGDGECWTLAQQAISQSAAGAAMVPQGYTHGALVYHAVGGAPAPICYADRIARGDICQFTSGRFDTRNAAGVIVGQAYVGAPNHTSIIVHVSDDNRTIDVLQQNVGGVRRVQAGKHNLDELVAGEVKIYRPVWKEWAGELEAKWD